MDLQSRKLNLISYLAHTQDEGVLNKIESFILNRKSKESSSDFQPFTTDEFVKRIEKSEQDFKKGKFKTHAEVEKIVKEW